MTAPPPSASGVLPRLRPSVADVPAYVPGRSGPGLIKLSGNENPFDPLPGVMEAATRALSAMNRYPDLTSSALIEELAATFAVEPRSLAVGTGSSAVLQQIVQSVAEPGDEIVYPWRSFESYPIVVQVSGATAVPVPLRPDGRLDLPAMAAAVTPRTRLVVVCSPNNPTGPAVTTAELNELLDSITPDVLVALDEAYVEYVRDEHAAVGMPFLAEHANLCVLHSFSKAYGLAGLRVGFAIAHPHVIAAVRAVAVPFGVSTVAEQAAIASLRSRDALLERVDATVRERERVLAGLRSQGWTVPDSQANFVWLPLANMTSRFAAACAEAGVLVRPFPDEGCRITIGPPAANDIVLAVTASWITAHHSFDLRRP